MLLEKKKNPKWIELVVLSIILYYKTSTAKNIPTENWDCDPFGTQIENPNISNKIYNSCKAYCIGFVQKN